MSLNNKCEPYLVNDRIFKIKVEIKSIKNKITICEDIISKFKLIPLSMQSGINKNIRGNKDFISIYEEDISRYKNQLQNLYISLEELKNYYKVVFIMEQMSFNLNELLKREVKQILEGGEPYIYNLIDNDCIEKNAEGIQKQKKLIEEYLIDNKIPKQIKKEVHLVGETLLGKKIFNTLFYEGFYIEGYKIKYDYTKSLCYFKFDPKHNGIVNKYISSKLKDIYLLLKDKFDIVPRYTTIIEYDYIKTKDNLGRDVLKKLYETERQYNAIQYLEITKFKSNINVNLEIIDDIKNNIEEFILEVKEDFI